MSQYVFWWKKEHCMFRGYWSCWGLQHRVWCSLVCVCQLCCPRKFKVSHVSVVIVGSVTAIALWLHSLQGRDILAQWFLRMCWSFWLRRSFVCAWKWQLTFLLKQYYHLICFQAHEWMLSIITLCLKWRNIDERLIFIHLCQFSNGFMQTVSNSIFMIWTAPPFIVC